MKQNLYDKAFMCLVGKASSGNLCASWREIAAPKKSSQYTTNLAYSTAELAQEEQRNKISAVSTTFALNWKQFLRSHHGDSST